MRHRSSLSKPSTMKLYGSQLERMTCIVLSLAGRRDEGKGGMGGIGDGKREVKEGESKQAYSAGQCTQAPGRQGTLP